MKKKIETMKKKKMRAAIVSVMFALNAAAMTVFASSKSVTRDYHYGNSIDAYLHVYLDFEEGKLWTRDTTWCNLFLLGSDRACISAHCEIGTSYGNFGDVTLNYGRLSKTYTKDYGWGASYAYVKTHMDNGNNYYLRTK